MKYSVSIAVLAMVLGILPSRSVLAQAKKKRQPRGLSS